MPIIFAPHKVYLLSFDNLIPGTCASAATCDANVLNVLDVLDVLDVVNVLKDASMLGYCCRLPPPYHTCATSKVRRTANMSY